MVSYISILIVCCGSEIDARFFSSNGSFFFPTL